jgi:hypothetical protein
LAEGTLFFVVPDVILTLTALFSFRAALRQTLAVLAGSLIAGALMFGWAARAPEPARATVMAVPFVRAAMAEEVRADLESYGAPALMRGPLSGIPYKLYAVEAPAHSGWLAFMALSVPARLARLVTGLLVFGAVGRWLRRPIAAHPRRAVLGWALYWIGIYAFYWTRT